MRVGVAGLGVMGAAVAARLESVDVLHEGDGHPYRAVRATCPADSLCRIPGLVARRAHRVVRHRACCFLF